MTIWLRYIGSNLSSDQSVVEAPVTPDATSSTALFRQLDYHYHYHDHYYYHTQLKNKVDEMVRDIRYHWLESVVASSAQADSSAPADQLEAQRCAGQQICALWAELQPEPGPGSRRI